jgi:hypothetical protein
MGGMTEGGVRNQESGVRMAGPFWASGERNC